METKPFYLTSEFWVAAVVSGTTWISHASQSGQLPLKWTAIVQSAVAVAYALARGLAKQGTPYTGE